MISSLRYTLVADGTSDRALMPLLRRMLLQTGTPLPLSGEWADPSRLPADARGFTSRLRYALDLYPCDLLFVHRDAEKQDPQRRYEEVQAALDALHTPPPVLCVVPVRMTEAWLLTDETAIHRAADNPHGDVPLSLPPFPALEGLPDPKQKLFDLLQAASELSGRRLDRFRRDQTARRLRVAGLTEDITPLQRLPAFERLQTETHQLLQEQGWL